MKMSMGFQGDETALRGRAWNQLVKTRPKPSMMTTRRLEQARKVLENDRHFWWDILDRHGLRTKSLDDLESSLRMHLIGNFWGQVCAAHMRSKGGQMSKDNMLELRWVVGERTLRLKFAYASGVTIPLECKSLAEEVGRFVLREIGLYDPDMPVKADYKKDAENGFAKLEAFLGDLGIHDPDMRPFRRVLVGGQNFMARIQETPDGKVHGYEFRGEQGVPENWQCVYCSHDSDTWARPVDDENIEVNNCDPANKGLWECSHCSSTIWKQMLYGSPLKELRYVYE